jgi:hypothetical protein
MRAYGSRATGELLNRAQHQNRGSDREHDDPVCWAWAQLSSRPATELKGTGHFVALSPHHVNGRRGFRTFVIVRTALSHHVIPSG